MVDVSKLKKGQFVTVRGKVTQLPDRDGDVRIEFSDGLDTYAPAKDIVSVEPLPIQVGDRVTWGFGAVNYTVVAKDEDALFLKAETGGYTVQRMNDVRHAA